MFFCVRFIRLEVKIKLLNVKRMNELDGKMTK